MKKLSLSIAFGLTLSTAVQAQKWEYISSASGEIPLTWKTTQQTASLVLDIDNDGINELVMGGRDKAPSLIYFKYDSSIGWREFAIEKEWLTIEAGGAFYDIDNDGDKDIVFGGDSQSNKLWWWENPFPFYNPNVPWKRKEIKKEGAPQHHDQVFGDFKQTGKAQLAFWNQGAKTLFIADIPAEPWGNVIWSYEPVFVAAEKEKQSWYAEGCTAADVDGDGFMDLIAGNYWFKYVDGKFKAIQFGEAGGRVIAAKFRAGKKMQIVVSPGDGTGRLLYYECTGSAEVTANWTAKDLIGRELVHGHTLEAADIDDDGNLDIFCAEMAKWSESKAEPDNANAEAFILYGDGKGGFRKTTFQKGIDFHEGRVYDVDGDGDMDIVSKPYNWNAPRLNIWLQNGGGKKLPNISRALDGRIGLELYSLRDYFKTDVAGTLAYVKSLGIKEVEVAGTYGMKPEDFRKELDKVGITPYSALLDYSWFKDSLDKVIATAKGLGVTYVGASWIPHKTNQFSKADADKAIAVFNKAGAALAKEGLHFFYHCHGYEFKPSEEGTIFDYMVQKTDAKNVSFECDVFWAFHGGQDPALLLKKHKGRFLAIHIKDMKPGQETGEFSGGAPLTSDVVVGTGQLNFPKILRAAIQSGVKYYYIEDENAEVMQHLPLTLRYLKSLK
ncbi:FG-GAP-like repeat-containing protein [Emticicia agri]|nr:FG-GAP-like repeat-containing protein [Emticicia agri]